jgi:hypothetical protein
LEISYQEQNGQLENRQTVEKGFVSEMKMRERVWIGKTSNIPTKKR